MVIFCEITSGLTLFYNHFVLCFNKQKKNKKQNKNRSYCSHPLDMDYHRKGQKKMTHALEGGAFICGAAVQWLRDEMQLITDAKEW